ncbi:MAG TPA: alkaline phosphatase family protein [Candidatus Angelobacter sp.]|nr:alkaline phosphatase family protein [Candidatus Angelobacter sp.]
MDLRSGCDNVPRSFHKISMTKLSRAFCSIVLLLSLIATAVSADKPKPKLLLAVVVDQFRYDYLTRFRADYHGGIARMLERGAVYTDAHYLHFPTVTAIGHSTFMSGALPSVSGIVGNDWYERDNKQHKPGQVTSVSDPDTKLVGGGPDLPGSSPRRLLVSTLPDELKMAKRSGKAIGISMKDRSAILPVGHMADAAYWFDADSSNFVTSTYYMDKLPSWVKQFNDTRPAFKYAGKPWTAVDAKPGDKPFCSMTAGAELRFCGAIEFTPFSNEMLEEMAEKAIENEQLGTHDGTDVLAISFSANDYVGHQLGPDAPEVRDISIRTDQTLKKLLDFLDARLGEGNTLVVFTADHGVAPVPEVNAARKMPGGRLNSSSLSRIISDGLSTKFGKGNWFVYDSGGFLYLNYKTVADNNADPVEVRRYAAEFARNLPHIGRVFNRDDMLRGGDAADPVGRAGLYGFYGSRSGDLVLLPEPYYMFSDSGTTHFAPYNYDTHVPLIFYGAGIRPGVHHQPAAVNDVAATLAAFLQVETPSGCSGKILADALEGLP